MAVEIRPITPDEMDAYVRLDAYAFAYEATEQVRSFYRTHYRTEWMLAVFIDGRMVAHLAVFPWRMMINGGALPFGAVADVAAWPEDRRSGHVGALLRHCLGHMRDTGLCLSALYPTFHALYRRFGWAPAMESRAYTFRAAGLDFLRLPLAGGCIERLRGEPVEALTAVYDQILPRGNGLVVRDAAHWPFRLLSRSFGTAQESVLWRDAAGAPCGYLVHAYPSRSGTAAPNAGGVGTYDQAIRVRELAAATPTAYRGLLDYLARHDLAGRITFSAAPDDPFRALLADPSVVQVEMRPGWMLRIVDLVPALESRAYLPGPPVHLALRVADTTAPWNDGTWLLTVEAGQARVIPTAAEPEISVDAGTLAALFNGFLTPHRAAYAGLLEAIDHRVLDVATRTFAVSAPPYCMDYF